MWDKYPNSNGFYIFICEEITGQKIEKDPDPKPINKSIKLFD